MFYLILRRVPFRGKIVLRNPLLKLTQSLDIISFLNAFFLRLDSFVNIFSSPVLTLLLDFFQLLIAAFFRRIIVDVEDHSDVLLKTLVAVINVVLPIDFLVKFQIDGVIYLFLKGLYRTFSTALLAFTSSR